MSARRPIPAPFAPRGLLAALLAVAFLLPGAIDRHAAVERSGVETTAGGVAVELAAVHGGLPAHVEASHGTERQTCLACALLAQSGGALPSTAWSLSTPASRAAAPQKAAPPPALRFSGPASGRAPPLT